LSGRLVINDNVRIKDAPYNMIAALMIVVCGNQFYLAHINYHQLMLSHGIIFLCFFAIYIYFTLLDVKQVKPHKKPLHQSHQHSLINNKSSSTSSNAKAFLQVIAGLIGLLIIGPGTSMPELIASFLALRAKSTAMVLGNIIGSNIFNIFFTLGITASIMPVPLGASLNQAVLFNLLAARLLIITFWFVPKKKISRTTALLLLLIYGVYTWLAIIQ
jgi:cation:H+ antiporter